MKFAHLLLLLAPFVVTGCASSEAKFVGKWETDTEFSQARGDQPGDRLLKGIDDFAKAVGPQLELRADHTFKMVIVFTIEGIWTSEGQTVTCTPQKVSGLTMNKDGKSPSDPIKLRLADDGKSLISANGTDQHWSLNRVSP